MMMARLLPLIFVLGCHFVGQSLAVQCYLLTGGENDAKTVAACNSSATGTEGSHSTCCNKGNGDACLSSGLCLNTISWVSGHMLWATGCTDETLKDASCPQVCQGSKYGGNGNYNLRSCVANGTTNDWCCSTGDDQTLDDCCKNSFKLPMAIGTVVHQFGAKASSSASSSATPSGTDSASTAADSACPSASTCPKDSKSGYVAGIAVTSVLFGLAAVGLVGAMLYIGKLKEQAKAAAAAPQSPSTMNGTLAPSAAAYSDYQQYHQGHTPTTTTPVTGDPNGYSSYDYGQQPRPELSGMVVNEMQGTDPRPNVPELPEKTYHQLP